MSRLFHQRQRGFTMVEVVVVMVITGIIGAIVAVFIKLPVRSYTDNVARAEAADMADATMRRLTRDLRLALPNSVRTNGAAIEFYETKAGLRYLSDDDVNTPVNGKVLSWTDSTKLEFTVVGGIPTLPVNRHAPVINDHIVVYNLGTDHDPANAYANCTGLCNRARIASIDVANSTMTLATNPFGKQGESGIALKSPSKRFHVVTWPVSYVCEPATKRLVRYWNYTPLGSAQTTSFTSGSKAILAENVEGCTFDYNTMASQRSGLIGITLKLRVKDDNRSEVTLMHQIHVDNTP